MSIRRNPPAWFPKITPVQFDPVSKRPTTFDLVVAVSDNHRDLRWMRDIDDSKYRIFIYCKTSETVSCPCTRYTIRYLPHRGEDVETFLYHICVNWWDLGDIVIFCHSNVFDLSPNILMLMDDNSSLETTSVLPLSIKSNDTTPPTPDSKPRREPMCVTDMQPRNYDCPVARQMVTSYREICGLTENINVMKHFVEELCGFANIPAIGCEDAVFAHGGMCAVAKSHVLRHGLHPFVAMRDVVLTGEPFVEMTRRVLLHIFSDK